MTLRLLSTKGPSQRRRKRAGNAKPRAALAAMRRVLTRCPACGKDGRTAAACDVAGHSEDARAEHDQIVASGADHVHMQCPACGHKAFVSFEVP